MTLTSLCEERNIQYCFVPSKAVLGRACGVKVPVAAAGLMSREGSQFSGQILELKDKIEQLFIWFICWYDIAKIKKYQEL